MGIKTIFTWLFPSREPPWHYLGYSELKWYDSNTGPDVITGCDIVRFYARGENLEDRRVETGRSGKYDLYRATDHSYYQKHVIPWINSDTNLWPPIHVTSQWFQDWTKLKTGYVRFGKTWVKPAPIEKREDNVITITLNKGKNG